jgi:uncharacterized protein (TIGR02145 family)
MKQQMKIYDILKILAILGILAQAAYAQQRIAIVNTEDDGEPQLKVTELNYLTARLREIAAKTLPKNEYSIMTEQSIMSRLGSKAEMERKCRESEGCLAKLGIDIEADYVGQGRIGRFGKNLTIKVELYGSASGNLISSFTGESKDIHGLLKELDKKAPAMFKELLPDAEVYTVPNQPATAQYTPTAPTASTTVATSSFKDSRDGKTYKTVKIGTQTWMAENLNYDAKGSKCYDNETENCDKYGRLYDWVTSKKACPSGWHLPSNAEWDKLYRFADGTKGTESPYKSETAGKYLKAKSGWDGGGNGEDKFGFSALPGGFGSCPLGGFYSIGEHGIWWSSSEYDSSDAYYRVMYYGIWDSIGKNCLHSVRCMEN